MSRDITYPAVRGKRREAFVKEAKESFERFETIINDDARVEQLPDGSVWVQAWVMVRNPSS